jgi:hypothetical protein
MTPCSLVSLFTDISEEHEESIYVEDFSNLKMEGRCSSETTDNIYQFIKIHTPDFSTLKM